MEINWKKRFDELVKLNELYMVRKLNLTNFVEKQFELIEGFEDLLNKSIKKEGLKAIRSMP